LFFVGPEISGSLGTEKPRTLPVLEIPTSEGRVSGRSGREPADYSRSAPPTSVKAPQRALKIVETFIKIAAVEARKSRLDELTNKKLSRTPNSRPYFRPLKAKKSNNGKRYAQYPRWRRSARNPRVSF